MMGNKPGGIFIDQHQATELKRLAGFATFVKLCMGLEDAEQFFLVGDTLTLQNTTTGRAANMLGTLDKDFDFRDSGN